MLKKHRHSRLRAGSAVGVLAAMGMGACTVSPNADELDSAQHAEHLSATSPPAVVMTREGTEFKGATLNIIVSEGAAYAQAQLSAAAPDKAVWSSVFAFDASEVRSTSVKLEQQPLKAGNGAVTIMGKNHEPVATSSSGTLSYTLHADGHFEGEADTPRDDLSASFSGRFSIVCLVYPETLGQEPNGYSPNGTVETRIADTEFVSSFCSPLRDLR